MSSTATKLILTDCFNSAGSIRSVSESVVPVEEGGVSAPPLDKSIYLGRAIGEFFTVNGKSQNNRLYTQELWEKALEAVQPMLDRGGLAGTFGHDRLLDEDTYMDGNISHKVTRLWIEGNVGMGEMLILNTKSGQSLNTYLRAGLPVAVSSRAVGSFLYEKGPNGEDIVDPATYVLETWDMVLNPGVSSAYPKMVESLQSDNTTKNEDIKMPGEEIKLYEQVATLSVKSEALNQKLAEALVANQKDQQALNEAKVLNEKLQKSVNFYRKYVGTPEDVKQISESLRKFTEFEPFKSVANSYNAFNAHGIDMKGTLAKMLSLTEKHLPAGTLEKANEDRKLLQQYKELGSVSELNRVLSMLKGYVQAGKLESITEAKKEVAAFKKLGSVEELSKAKSELKVYEELGTVAEINRALSILSSYAKLGKISEVKQIFRVAEAYVRLGNPKALIERLKAATIAEKKSEKQAKEAISVRIAEKFEVSTASVEKMLAKMSEAEVIETLKGIREENSISDRFRVADDTDKTDVNENAKTDKKVINLPVGPKTLADQMFRSIPKAEGFGVTQKGS